MKKTIMIYFLSYLILIFGCAPSNKIISDETAKPENLINSENNINESADNSEKIPGNINVDIILPEIKTPVTNGIRLNIFSSKTQYKLGEPIKILSVVRNKAFNIVKIKIENFLYSGYCYPLFTLTDDKDVSNDYFSFDMAEFVEVEICPNAVFCFENDIQELFDIEKPGKFRIQAKLIGNNFYPISNIIEFEVIE